MAWHAHAPRPRPISIALLSAEHCAQIVGRAPQTTGGTHHHFTARESGALRPQVTTSTRRLYGTAVGMMAAGFLSAATIASASNAGAGASCPAYPWSPQDGTRGGHKVFMQSDCAACHSGLPYAGLALAVGGEVEAKTTEIVVVHGHEEEATVPLPASATTLHGGACPPDLSVITMMLEGLRRGDLYNADDIKKRMAALPSSPVWLQFLQPYTRSPQAA